MTTRETIATTKDGLPREAFAIPGDPADPDTWKLPHHKKSIFRALKAKMDIEKTVDWEQMALAVSALSPRICGEGRLCAGPEDTLEAARHLAEHYRKAGKPLPDTLAAMA